MRAHTFAAVAVLASVILASGTRAQDRPAVSFKDNVFPVIKKYCLPCHAEDNHNPSGLVLDTYETLMAGGEHGKALEPGKGLESMLVKKLGPEPPFGKTMPVQKRKKQGSEPIKSLTQSEIQLLVDWIDQGAKNN